MASAAQGRRTVGARRGSGSSGLREPPRAWILGAPSPFRGFLRSRPSRAALATPSAPLASLPCLSTQFPPCPRSRTHAHGKGRGPPKGLSVPGVVVWIPPERGVPASKKAVEELTQPFSAPFESVRTERRGTRVGPSLVYPWRSSGSRTSSHRPPSAGSWTSKRSPSPSAGRSTSPSSSPD